jgi:hypothetical protein
MRRLSNTHDCNARTPLAMRSVTRYEGESWGSPGVFAGVGTVQYV